MMKSGSKNLRLALCTTVLLIAVFILCGTAGLSETLTLPAAVQEVSQEAFYGDASLDEVVIPDGIRTIGPRAFASSSVRRIYLPESLSSIASDAFSGCSGITGYGMPGTYAAQFCAAHNIPYEAYSTPIEEFTFSYPNAVEATLTGWSGTGDFVVIPSMADENHEITRIGSNVFKGKTALRTVSFPSCVKFIDDHAFDGCKG